MSQKMWNNIPDMFFVTPIMVGYMSRWCCVNYLLISRYSSYVGCCGFDFCRVVCTLVTGYGIYKLLCMMVKSLVRIF